MTPPEACPVCQGPVAVAENAKHPDGRYKAAFCARHLLIGPHQRITIEPCGWPGVGWWPEGRFTPRRPRLSPIAE